MTRPDWRRVLTPEQFRVTRDNGTERPWTSPLNGIEPEAGGTFVCSSCGNPLFEARTKYKSGTGWPSFYDVIGGAVGSTTDYDIGYPR